MTSQTPADLIHAVHIDDIPATDVCAGIVSRPLPTSDFARGWLIDFEPGTQWPETDHHVAEERYFVISGEIVDNGQHYPAGTYVVFAPGSSHRPSSDVGARIIGISAMRAGKRDEMTEVKESPSEAGLARA